MNRILLLLALVLFPISLSAIQLDLGIHAGVTFARHTYTEFSRKTDRKPGFTGGASFEISKGNVFALQPELLFIEKGSDEGSTSSGLVDVSRTQYYLELPFLFKWTITPNNYRVQGYIYLGPYTAVLLFAYGGGESENSESYFGETDDYKRVDFGGTFGGGISIKVGIGEITVDVRNSIGFIPSLANNNARNSNITVIAGYTFYIGNRQ